MSPRVKAALLAGLPLVLLTPPLVWLGQDFAGQLAREQRLRAQHMLEVHAGAVQRSLDQLTEKLDGLATFVAGQTALGRTIDEERFRTYAAGLHAGSNWIRAFQIVTGGTITHVYPLAGNEAVRGYDLMKDPRPVIGGDVERALRTGQVTITGPLELVQGGLGLIMRQPLPPAAGGPRRLVAIVFNLAPLLAESGIDASGAGEFQIAMRRAGGETFFGPPAVFARQPVTRRLALADGAWEIGGGPRSGWPASISDPVLRFYLAGAALILLLCLLVYVLASSQAMLTLTVRARTDALRHELEARQQAEDELRQNFALLRAVTEGTSDTVFAKDAAGRYRMINSAGAAFHGATPEAILGRTDVELFAAETAREIVAEDRRVMESNEPLTSEGRLATASRTGLYQSTKAPWRDRDGRVIGVVGVSRDITERKQMEEALRRNEQQLSLILNNVSDVIFAIAVEPGDAFRFTSVNRRFLDATGLAADQIVGAPVRAVIPEPALTMVLGKYREAIASGSPVQWEEESVYPAGRKLGQVTLVPVRDSQGVCVQLVGMVHDITERKHAEEALRESEAHYRELFENNPAPMLIYDRGTLQLLAVNEAFERHYGYTRAEALALRLPDLYPAPDKAAITSLVPQLQGYAYVGEWRHLKRDGSQITIVARSHDIAFAGRAARIAVINDITERKLAEESRKASEAQVRALLVAADCLLWQAQVTRTDAGGLEWRYYIPRSGLYRRLYGTDPGTLHWDDLGVPELPEMHARCLQALTTGAPGYENEFHATVGGQTIWLHEQVSATRETESAWRLVGVITDVTEKKRAEAEIRKSAAELEQRVAERTAELAVARDNAQAADRLKSAFLATMSHELRTPLNSIIGFTGILLQGLAGPLKPEQRKQLEMVQGSARHLLALINDVLDISKIEAGQLVMANEPFELRPAIEHVAGSIRPMAEAKGLALRLDLPPELPPWRGDRRRFEQVLLNLLNNAVKFTEHGGVTLTVTPATGAAGLRLAVRDTGIGIKPGDLALLFRPFQQIDTGLTRQHEGTGLGLAICRRLAALMGGAIEVESDWGKGSVFTFTLPHAAPAPADGPPLS